MQKSSTITAEDFKIVQTSNFSTVQRICYDAQNRHSLTAIIGYTGAGKTTGLEHYYNAGTNVYYVRCKNSMNRKQFLQAVLNEMGVNYFGTVYDMVETLQRN